MAIRLIQKAKPNFYGKRVCFNDDESTYVPESLQCSICGSIARKIGISIHLFICEENSHLFFNKKEGFIDFKASLIILQQTDIIR